MKNAAMKEGHKTKISKTNILPMREVSTAVSVMQFFALVLNACM
jgi:hypothetical protein